MAFAVANETQIIRIIRKMTQQYEKYTEDEQAVWKLLFDRQMARLPGRASQAYLDGIVATGFPNSHIPDFERDLNPRLLPITGWRVVAVPGLIGNREFFELMADRQFPATTWLRTRDQLDYLPEPDMFHDTFGHVPVLTNQALLRLSGRSEPYRPAFCGA